LNRLSSSSNAFITAAELIPEVDHRAVASEYPMASGTASSLGALYEKIYATVCGQHPTQNILHFQWLAVKDLRSDLRSICPTLKGSVLDVGCGDKPYASCFNPGVVQYLGLDLVQSPGVDVVADENEPWPLPDSTTDVILCSQVLEHVPNLDKVLDSIHRVLKPGGLLLVTAPFIYNLHGEPRDFRRFSAEGIRQIFENQYEIIEVRLQGAAGSSLGSLWLNWLDTSLNEWKVSRLLKGLLMPLWILFCVTVNLAGWLLDKVDRTQSFYGNVLLLARKR
jgi:SAM-dependent methyltransferase